jgi:hypothetical protein|nr:zf-HC2 domain-containing protein [Candidatus Krumholzibacteria bacterium]
MNQWKEHPELDTLVDHHEGLLSGEDAARVARHLEDCPECALELKRYLGFMEGGEDVELPDFPVLPMTRKVHRLPSRRWLWVPAAAAAAAVLVFGLVLMPAEGPDPVRGPARSAALRGAGDVPEPTIVLDQPVGELEERPALFAWQAAVECDHFTVEVFTADLDLVFSQQEVEGPEWAAPDSLAALLEPDVTFLWSVRGFRKLEQVADSGNGWFVWGE